MLFLFLDNPIQEYLPVPALNPQLVPQLPVGQCFQKPKKLQNRVVPFPVSDSKLAHHRPSHNDSHHPYHSFPLSSVRATDVPLPEQYDSDTPSLPSRLGYHLWSIRLPEDHWP
jgi:hypothetical protein